MRSRLFGPLELAKALAAVAVFLAFAPSSSGYIDGPVESLTLPKLLLEFGPAGVFQVERVDAERGAILYKSVEWLQGPEPVAPAKHIVGTADRYKAIKPGVPAIIFGPDPYGRGITLVEGIWYITNVDRDGGWWRNAEVNYDMNCCFLGTVAELSAAIRTLHRGEDLAARCRIKSHKEPSQWVSYSLRNANRKTVVAAPSPVKSPAPPQLSASQWADKLLDPKLADRVAAAEALAKLGADAKPATAALAAALAQEKDPIVRRFEAVALGRIGPDARIAAAALIALVQGGYEDVNCMVGVESVAALRKIDPRGETCLPLLQPMLQKDREINTRRRAVSVINMIGWPLTGAQPALLRALKEDTDGDVRSGAAGALIAVKADVKVVVPALIESLKDENNFVRMASARGLGALGAAARPAIPQLKRALTDSDAEVRQYAEQALVFIAPK